MRKQEFRDDLLQQADDTQKAWNSFVCVRLFPLPVLLFGQLEQLNQPVRDETHKRALPGDCRSPLGGEEVA